MLFVELSRFKTPSGDINKLLDLKSQWCYLIKESGRLTHEKAKLLARKGEDMGLALKFLYELSADHLWVKIQKKPEQRLFCKVLGHYSKIKFKHRSIGQHLSLTVAKPICRQSK